VIAPIGARSTRPAARDGTRAGSGLLQATFDLARDAHEVRALQAGGHVDEVEIASRWITAGVGLIRRLQSRRGARDRRSAFR
jgi:hypothetical protein